MVEDLNDNEIMEPCKPSNELNACETTAIFYPSRFVSHAARFGFCEGFAVDLTVVRADGTIWDFSREDDKVDLRRLQHREQSELLAGSPPSYDFSSFVESVCET